MEGCHWWYCWHHVTLTPVSMALHDERKLCCTLFQCLDLMYTVVLLTMPLASHDVDAKANSVQVNEKVMCASCCILQSVQYHTLTYFSHNLIINNKASNAFSQWIVFSVSGQWLPGPEFAFSHLLIKCIPPLYNNTCHLNSVKWHHTQVKI